MSVKTHVLSHPQPDKPLKKNLKTTFNPKFRQPNLKITTFVFHFFTIIGSELVFAVRRRLTTPTSPARCVTLALLCNGMTDLELIKQDEMRQRRIVLFRNDIINNERLKAFRHILFVQKQRLQLKRQQQTHLPRISQQSTVAPSQSQSNTQNLSVSHGSAVTNPTHAVAQQTNAPKLDTSSKNISQTPTRQTTLVPKRTIASDRELEIKAAHFAYLRQHVVHDLSVWSNN